MSDIMKKMPKSGKNLFAGIIAFSIVLSLFIFPHYVFAGSVPDTGQTKCYDNDSEITCPQSGEPFYGQDAQYAGPARSYTKLGQNGTPLPDTTTQANGWIMTRDNVTGLVWEVKQDKDDVKDCVCNIIKPNLLNDTKGLHKSP